MWIMLCHRPHTHCTVQRQSHSWTTHTHLHISVAATAFDCIRGTGTAYFKHVCTPASDISGQTHLRSAERRDMLVPRTRTELGWQSFPVAAPTVSNSLPAHLRSTLISRRQFRDGLKSHLFADAYFWSSENIRYKSVLYLLTYLLMSQLRRGGTHYHPTLDLAVLWTPSNDTSRPIFSDSLNLTPPAPLYLRTLWRCTNAVIIIILQNCGV